MRNEHISATRAIDVMAVVKKSFLIYRKYVGAVLFGGTILLAFSVLTQSLSLESLFLATLVSVLLNSLVQTWFIRYIHTREQGHEKTLSQISQESLKYMPYGLLISACTLLITFTGIIFLIIPGIIWSVMFSQAFFYVVLQRKGIKEALSLSRVRTKGNRIAILRTYWSVYFPFFVVSILLYLFVFSISSSVQVYFNGLITVIASMLFPIIGYELYTHLEKNHKAEK